MIFEEKKNYKYLIRKYERERKWEVNDDDDDCKILN